VQVRETILDAMMGLGRPIDGSHSGTAPLDLESLEVVMLHDVLEQAFEVRIPASRVTPASFATLDSLVALVEELRA
jgi:acyl carrier protein